jgi:PAS domain-containing protein
MRIRQRLKVNTTITGFVAVVLLLVLSGTAYRVARALDGSRIADSLMAASFERLMLRTDYVETNSGRAREQVRAKYRQISELLKSASETFTDPEDKKTVDSLAAGHESIGKIFRAVMANRDESAAGSRTGAFSREIEERLLSQLNIRIYEVGLLVGKLQDSASSTLSFTLRAAGLSILLIVLFVSAAGFINSWAMGRTIANRVNRLSEGAGMIGEGSLEHRIDVKGDDEFAELSDAFNSMAGKLRDSYRDLENEVAVRTQAETTLQETLDELEIRVEERTADLKAASETARTERQRLYDVLETLPVYVALLTPDYHIPFANRFFRERFGESGGKRCYEYLFNRAEPCDTCETYTALKTNEQYHWHWTGPDSRDYDVHDYPFIDSDGSKMILEMGIDITDRLRAEDALKQAKETLEQRVADGTADLRMVNEELKSINEELGRFNRAAVGRELRMIELKKEINLLCAELGRPPRYPSQTEEEKR